jgi:hypothetical protein
VAQVAQMARNSAVHTELGVRHLGSGGGAQVAEVAQVPAL